jgi:hypothetical protein
MVQLDLKGKSEPVATRIVDLKARSPPGPYFQLPASDSIRRTPSSS